MGTRSCNTGCGAMRSQVLLRIPPNTPHLQGSDPRHHGTGPLFKASVPPFTAIIAPMAACMTRKEMTSSQRSHFPAMPMAMPMENRIGRFANTISPARLITVNNAFQKVPGPMIRVSPYVSSIVVFEKEPPIPSNSPATAEKDRQHKRPPDPLQDAKDLIFHESHPFVSLLRKKFRKVIPELSYLGYYGEISGNLSMFPAFSQSLDLHSPPAVLNFLYVLSLLNSGVLHI